jgi:hypothetical protein
MTARRLRTLAVCALIVLAGCAGGTVGGPEDVPFHPTGQSGAEAAGVVVERGPLDVEVNRTYERVQGLVDVDLAGTRVVVRDLTSYKTTNYGNVPFFSVLGIRGASLDASEPAGLTTFDSTVYISPAAAGPERVEQVLAHEFVHVAQIREGMVPWFGGLSLTQVSLDKRLARRGLVEGGAVYVTDAYTRQHLSGVQLQSASVAEGYADGPTGNRLVWGQYHFGYQYVAATIDDTDELATVYDDAPETTENVLHPGNRDELVPLDVAVETRTDEFRQTTSRTGRAGELVTRIVLREDTTRATAIEASAGWGNDRVVTFTDGVDEQFAWVTRWDSERDAEEFEQAARELETDAYGYDLRVERLDADTVVVFGGTEEFLADASVSGNVTVTV